MKRTMFLALLILLAVGLAAVSGSGAAGHRSKAEIYVPKTVPVTLVNNVSIMNTAETVTISWEAMTDALTYKVYSTDDPYGTFLEDLTGVFAGTSWSAPIATGKRFYYVTAMLPETPVNTLLITAHDVDNPTGPDLHAEILLEAESFDPPIYTPYTFGVAGNLPFQPGEYSVSLAGYSSWNPDAIGFLDITTSYTVDFLGTAEPTPGHTLLITAHDVANPNGPDLNAQILREAEPFNPPIYTPYTFGAPGSQPFLPGEYSVTHPNYDFWNPGAVNFFDIINDYTTDFLGTLLN